MRTSSFWKGRPVACVKKLAHATKEKAAHYRVNFQDGDWEYVNPEPGGFTDHMLDLESFRTTVGGCSHPVAGRKEARSSLSEDDATRNNYPMWDGLGAYFPNALAAVSEVSKVGNDQHNPGQPMHWARSKSTDHANKIMRHLIDHGKKDARGIRHTARLAWRALALLQEELEREEGAPLAPGAKE